MRMIYHLPVSPFCRKIRIVLAEKKLDADLVTEPIWQRRQEFLALNPAGLVPVLVEESGRVLADSMAIAEYLEEIHGDPNLLPFDAAGRAETRRLPAWFDEKFHAEVTRPQIGALQSAKRGRRAGQRVGARRHPKHPDPPGLHRPFGRTA